MPTKQEPGYFTTIPAVVRHCPDIQDGAKLLFGDIAGLCRKEGYCWATNSTLAEIAGVKESTVRDYLRALEEAGFIRRESDDGRRIFVAGVSKIQRQGAADIQHHTISKDTKKDTIDDFPSIEELAEYFHTERRLKKRDAELQAHEFTEYWSQPDNLSRVNAPPNASRWRGRAATWVTNGLKYEKFELMSDEDFKRDVQGYTLEEIEFRPGSGAYDKTRYYEKDGKYFRRD